MDTLLLQRPTVEKTAASAASIGIAICLILTQNLWIVAKDIGVITGISPKVPNLAEQQRIQEEIFEEEILAKYRDLKIVDVDKGIKHVQMIKHYSGKPVRINIVEVSGNAANTVIEPAIASDVLSARSKISKIASRENAIVAINAGYFKPQTGVPLGTLMINRKIYTGPVYDRVCIGIFDNKYEMARLKLKAELKTNIGGLQIDNINQPRMLSTHAIVYTRDWGTASPESPKYGMQMVIENNKIIKVSDKSCEIPQNGFVIVGPESKLKAFENAKDIKLDVKLNPDWDKVKHIISGGPYLVKNGEIFVDMTEEKLTSIGGRNPRTAIGYTKDNNLILVTADGREGASVGLTLNELASLMKNLGCVNAMNLDGGSSTVMLIKGQVVNKPTVQGGIPLSQTLMVRKIS